HGHLTPKPSGAGQISIILIPINDKNPLPLPFPQKKAQGLMFFDFLRPNDCLKIRELPCHVNGFSNFFQLFWTIPTSALSVSIYVSCTAVPITLPLWTKPRTQRATAFHRPRILPPSSTE